MGPRSVLVPPVCRAGRQGDSVAGPRSGGVSSYTRQTPFSLARNLNRRWDQGRALDRLGTLEIPLRQRVGDLSGGQKAQLALTIALARRPELLVLDEPLASLDPVAREDFLAAVVGAADRDGVSVVLSSHVLAELERVATYLVVLARGQVQVAGTVAELLASHGAGLEEIALRYLRAGVPSVSRTEGAA
jgi:ABC-2 type transport system ATP-binding protein